jgi:hypothetical protein
MFDIRAILLGYSCTPDKMFAALNKPICIRQWHFSTTTIEHSP